MNITFETPIYTKNKENTIFLHIPKTAGNSIRTILPATIHFKDHNTRSEGYEWLYQFLEDRRDWFSFIFVRNPFDRLVSAFFCLKSGGFSKLDIGDFNNYVLPYIDPDMTINDVESFESFILNGLRKASLEQLHFRPITNWVTDREGKLIISAYGKVETLEGSLRSLFKLQGWQYPERELPRRNESEHRPYQYYFRSKAVIDAVIDIYYRDFENFQYRIDPYK